VGKSSLLNALVGRTTGGLEATGWSQYAKGVSCPKAIKDRIIRVAGRWQYPRTKFGHTAPFNDIPGCTRSLDFYRGEAETKSGEKKPIQVVDLPGYGYAEATSEELKTWREMVRE
jgi:GTP-binding protein EngB required for normal cell division